MLKQDTQYNTWGNFLEPKCSGDLSSRADNSLPSDKATSRDDIRAEGK